MSAAASSTIGSGLPTSSSRAQEEFYLATFWSYRPRGITHILERAKAVIDTPQFEVMYDPRQQWFKVICPKDQAPSVQGRLIMLLKSLDGDLSWDRVVSEDGNTMPDIKHPWIQSLRDYTAWSFGQLQAPLGADQDPSPIDRAELPDSVRLFEFVRRWSEIDDNEHETVDIDKILPADSRLELERSTGASITADGMGRIVYIGGHAQEAVDSAYKRLSCILKRSHDKPFEAVHLLYSEANHVFEVDARLMSAINPTLVATTLVDPKAGSRMADEYKAISRAASLRIALPNPVSRGFRSLFGPCQPACFKLEEARRYCRAFNNFAFKPKQKVPRLADHRPQLPSHTAADKEASVDAYVETWIQGVPDHSATSPPPPPGLDLSGQLHSASQAPQSDQLYKQKVQLPVPLRLAVATVTSPASCAIKHAVLPAAVKEATPVNPPAATTKKPAPLKAVGANPSRSKPNAWSSLAPASGSIMDRCPWGRGDDAVKWPELPSKTAKVSRAHITAQKSNPSRSETADTQQPPSLILSADSPMSSTVNIRQPSCVRSEAWPPTEPRVVDSLSEFPALGMPRPSSSLAPGDPKMRGERGRPLSANNQGGLDGRASGPRTQQHCDPSAGTFPQQRSLLDDDLPAMPAPTPLSQDGDPQAIRFNMEALVPTKSPSSAHPAVRQDDDRSSVVFYETMGQKAASRKKVPQRTELGPTRLDPEPGFLGHLTANMARLSERLRYRSGKVSLEVVFGRICLKDFTPSGLAKNTRNQEARGWRPEQLLEGMQKAYSRPDTFHFARILSLFGQDADALCGLPEATSWTLDSRRVVYEFTCEGFGTANGRLGERAKQFVVEIDAINFGFTIGDPNRRLAPVAIHCLHRHWDFEVVASHSPTKELEAKYSEFARGLVDSLEIPPNTNRTPTLYYELEPTRLGGGGGTAGARVKDVRVRYTARHKCPGGGTYLDIAQVQDMTTVSQGMRDGWERFHSFPARECAEAGRASLWFEASLSSAKAEALFKTNESLGLGEEAAWTVESMEEAGCFKALWEPALAMVKQMDHIGVETWAARGGREAKAEKAPREEKGVDDDGFW